MFEAELVLLGREDAFDPVAMGSDEALEDRGAASRARAWSGV